MADRDTMAELYQYNEDKFHKCPYLSKLRAFIASYNINLYKGTLMRTTRSGTFSLCFPVDSFSADINE